MADAERKAAGPGGHLGAAIESSAADRSPVASTSDKSLPGPATNHATPDADGDAPDDRLEDQLAGPVETIDLPAVALLRRASAGAGPGLPFLSGMAPSAQPGR